ncbi:DUF1758 domain-containing protein [Trichonephila clavipes]|nr:DUF1758 domain-containing protein [Trichonephila clavipes]
MLEMKLRALDSLGQAKEKFADFLEPLVKSCLPESVLRAWERSRVSEDNDHSTSQGSLEKLMYVPDVATTAMLVSTNVSHDRIPKAKERSEVANNLLNNNYNDKVYLQTICVEIVDQGDRIRVRGLLNSGSSRSYISDKVIKYLNLRWEKIIHGLFGGKETAPLEYGMYAVKINDLSGGSFKLCSGVSSERKCVQLNLGLAAMHIKLRWAVIGKETGLGSSNDEIAVGSSVQTFLSLYVSDISLKELSEIDSLGIRDPIGNVSKRKLFDESN